MHALPVLIHNKKVKILIVLGIIVPLIILFILATANAKTKDSVVALILIPLFTSIMLFPFTGILRDIVNILPQNALTKLMVLLSDHGTSSIESNIEKASVNPDPAKRIDPRTAYNMINYMLLTGFEYTIFIFGIIFLLIVAPLMFYASISLGY
jgi:hypothetical protein